METEITVRLKTLGPEQVKVDKSGLVELDKGSFPLLHLQGTELPFGEDDIGKEVSIIGMVKLSSVKFQGYNYVFEMTKLDFPGREFDKGTTKARKRKKVERGG